MVDNEKRSSAKMSLTLLIGGDFFVCRKTKKQGLSPNQNDPKAFVTGLNGILRNYGDDFRKSRGFSDFRLHLYDSC